MRITKSTESPEGTVTIEIDTEPLGRQEDATPRLPTHQEYQIIRALLDIPERVDGGDGMLPYVSLINKDAEEELSRVMRGGSITVVNSGTGPALAPEAVMEMQGQEGYKCSPPCLGLRFPHSPGDHGGRDWHASNCDMSHTQEAECNSNHGI